MRAPEDFLQILTSNVGFYRPVVALSFAADFALWGVDAKGYGITNIVLSLVAAYALYGLARQLHLSVAASLAAPAVWLFNFHAVNMAVLWLSGRTALLVSVFSLAAARAVLGGRVALGAVLCLLAMLSKEEAVVLPALFTAAHVLESGRLHGAARLLPLWGALAVYVPLRMYSGAFWPGDAPAFYQFSLSAPLLLRNAAEYADRAGTAATVAAIALVAATRVGRAQVTPEEARAFRFGALWIPATFALTLALPVRSSLYALLPSIGMALAVAAIASAAQRVSPVRFRRVAIVLLAIVAVLVPVYRARNVRWVRLAEISETSMQTIARDAGDRPSGHIVLVDAPQERFNLTSAFGNLLPEALQLRVGTGWTGEIVGAAGAEQRAADFVYALEGGQLVVKRRPESGRPSTGTQN